MAKGPGGLRLAGIGMALAGLALSGLAQACPAELASRIPARLATAPTGSQFLQQIADLSDDAREAAIVRELRRGNLPAFLRQARPVRLGRITVCVMPDYLAVGTDRDHILVPMQLASALAVGREFGFVLPTSRIVDATYEQAAVKLSPQSLPPTDQMRSTGYYARHNALVQAQRAQRTARPGALTAGNKKDLVLTPRLWTRPDRVAIYGWHRAAHKPIQPLSTVHGWRYADYSHGVRLVAATAYVDGQPRSLVELLADDRLAAELSHEGPLRDLHTLIDRSSTIAAVKSARRPA